MTRYELVDWTPARHPPILLPERMGKHRRKTAAWKCNMHLRKVGTRYIHNGGKTMSDHQVIPEAAVEAAAQMLAEESPEDWSGEQWANERIDDSYRKPWRDKARRILEAAAPHMAAQVWDEGMEAMHAATGSEWPTIPEANPYRPTP